MNGLTDIRDVSAFTLQNTLESIQGDEGLGCSSVIVDSERTALNKPIVAQTWDLFTDNLPFVCLVRYHLFVNMSCKMMFSW